jgi:hypothetical protein
MAVGLLRQLALIILNTTAGRQHCTGLPEAENERC